MREKNNPIQLKQEVCCITSGACLALLPMPGNNKTCLPYHFLLALRLVKALLKNSDAQDTQASNELMHHIRRRTHCIRS